jgi:hypothetical protein
MKISSALFLKMWEMVVNNMHPNVNSKRPKGQVSANIGGTSVGTRAFGKQKNSRSLKSVNRTEKAIKLTVIELANMVRTEVTSRKWRKMAIKVMMKVKRTELTSELRKRVSRAGPCQFGS